MSRKAPLRARLSRGVTLVEVLITVAIVSLVTTMAVLGMGVLRSARLKQSAVMIAGAIRIGYAHANAISKPVRLVFDFEQRMVSLEEGSSQLYLAKNDKTGGANAATEAERLALEEAEKIVKAPPAPRPDFKPTRAFGFSPDKDKPGKELADGVRFLQVEVAHEEEPSEGRAYLYFWPRGQTERAAIQLVRGSTEAGEDGEVMTILVSPLTGKAEIKKGKLDMPRPRSDEEESERDDTGF